MDSHVCPVPELPEHVLVVLHPCSVARRLDQQISHRRSTRSVAGARRHAGARGQEPALRHPRRRPAPRARRRRRGPAADPADLRRDRPDLRPGRAHGGVRRHRPGRARLGQHPPGAGACPPDRRGGVRAPPPIVELYDPSLPEVEGDRDRLVQVFLNLVKNAAEAAPPRAGRSRWPPSTSTGCGSAWATAASGWSCRSPSRSATTAPACPRAWSTTCSSRSSAPSAAAGARPCRWSPRSWPTTGGVVSYLPGRAGGGAIRVRLPAARQGAAAGSSAEVA